MPPRSKYDRPVANRVFTNREGPIAAFDAARARLPADRHRVLTYYGLGGQGKTTLRKHLIARLAAESPHRHPGACWISTSPTIGTRPGGSWKSARGCTPPGPSAPRSSTSPSPPIGPAP